MIRTKNAPKVKSKETAEELSIALGGRETSPGQFMALCPAHNDSEPSLAITDDNGKILHHCFAGCEFEDIIKKFKTRGIVLNGSNNKFKKDSRLPKGIFFKSGGKRFAAYWIYKNENGEVLGINVRYDSSEGEKSYLPYFKQQNSHWEPGYAYKDDRPLYNMDKIKESNINDEIWVVEGEKCADALTKLGCLATTSPGGSMAANKANWEPLRGRKIIIWPDNDDAGRKYARDVIKKIKNANDSKPDIKLVDIEKLDLDEKEDVHDWINNGHGKKDISKLPLLKAKDYIKDIELDEPNNALNLEVLPQGDISQYFQTFDQMKTEGVKRPKLLLKPWLRVGETNILYSDAGVGKSLLATLIGYVLGLEECNEKECDIGPWQVMNQTGTLYIDGELGKAEMRDRIKKLKWLGEQRKDMQMIIFSLPEFQVRSGKDFNLSKRASQRKIVNWLKDNPKYKFLVIDSVSTVFNLENENDNSEWNRKINPFLKDLRALGVALLILHHAGKDNKLRGASSMTAMVYNIIRLTNDPGKEPGQAFFSVDNNLKQRAAGKLFGPFTLKFNLVNKRTEWEVPKSNAKKETSNKTRRIMAEIVRGTRQKDIAKDFGCETSYVSQLKAKAIANGYLDSKGNQTSMGIDLIKHHDEDNI